MKRAVGVVRVVPRRQPQLGARRLGEVRAARRAAAGTTVGHTAAYRRSSGRPIRGPARAAPSRPGRRVCAPAAPAHRARAVVQRARSGRSGRRPPGRPSVPTSTRSTSGLNASHGERLFARGRRRPRPNRAAGGGRRSARWSASPSPRPRSTPASPGRPTAPRTTVASWRRQSRTTAATAPRSRATAPGRSIAAARRFRLGSGRVSAPDQTVLNRCHPDLGHDVVDERLAAGVLAHLGVDAEQRAQQPLQRRLLALPASVEPVPDGRDRRHHGGSDGVHHVVGVALQQGAEHQQLVQRLAAAARTARRAATRGCRSNSVGRHRRSSCRGVPCTNSASRPTTCGDVVAASSVSTASALRHVVGQPRVRAELHPVGDLVQAHPQPEVGGRHPQLTLDGDHVGIHQQQLTAAVLDLANGSYWPRMPDDTNASTAPVWAPVMRPVMTPGLAPGPRRRRSSPASTAMRRGSTRAGRRCARRASRRPRCRPVTSRTGHLGGAGGDSASSLDRLAAGVVGGRRVRAGPAWRPTVAANSQSTARPTRESRPGRRAHARQPHERSVAGERVDARCARSDRRRWR